MATTDAVPNPSAPLRAALRDWLDQRVVRRAARNSGVNGARLEEVRKSVDTLPEDVLRAVIHSLLTKPPVLDAVARRVAQRSGKGHVESAEMLRRMANEWRQREEGKALHAAVVADLRLKAAN